MKRYLNIFIGLLLPLFAVSCLQEDMVPVVGNDEIVFTIDSGTQTKAVADTDIEAKVTHIDVVIFNSSEGYVYNERVSVSGNTFALARKKSEFTENAEYSVYLIANSTAEATAFAVADMDGLKSIVQSDPNLMFTGMSGEGNPSTFLMDGVAYAGDTEPTTPGTVILNAGDAVNTTLKATLRRAAAKIYVTINKGDNVTFLPSSSTATPQYYMRNYPYSTKAIAEGYDINPSLITSTRSVVSGWSDTQITITAYAYAYEWKNKSITEETSMIVNIPLTFGGTDHNSNWYKIPVSKESVFERNTYYAVTVTVNTPGAENWVDPTKLEDIRYETIEWNDVTLNIGGDSNRPSYLQLNTNHVDMYNVNEDNTTLEFASSSEIKSIELVSAYYFNKHGVHREVPAEIRENIAATAEAGVLNGDIEIFSPIVATTQAERDALIAALGTPPTDPGIERPVDPRIDEVEEPDPEDFLPGNEFYVTYSYEGEGKDVRFYRDMWFVGRTEMTDIRDQYLAAYEAYEKYLEWANKTAAEKQALIDAYEAAMAEYEAKYAEYNAYYLALHRINSTAEPSHHNTIRYLEFKVTNKDGKTVNFTVNQYPVIYITNSLGWYSYRKDFKVNDANPTTYEYKGDGIVSVSLEAGTNGGNRYWKNNYSTAGGSGYWFSKARPANSENATGTLRTQSYEYGNNGNGSLQTENAGNSDNLRLYHVNITTTSHDYVVARPKMVKMTNVYEEGATELTVTDPSEENQKLVSPSFMIASRLGYFITSQNTNLNDPDMTDEMRLEVFRKHCANYVEVHGTAGNKVVYDNWRLPTEAELKIIMDTQGRAGEDAAAVDYLLNAMYYFGAAGPVFNTKNDDNATTPNLNTNSKSARCVRDAY